MGRIAAPRAGDSQQWPKLKLSTQHKELWMETRAAALYSQPALSDVWYNMMVDKDGQQAWFTDQVPIAATDDRFMYLNPNTFFKDYDLDERLFIIFHEEFHSIFNHCGLFYHLQQAGYIQYPDGIRLPYKSQIMQSAADCVINDILHVGNIGKMPKDCWHRPKLIQGTMSVTDAYRKMYEENKQKQQQGGQQRGGKGSTIGSSNGNGQKSFDQHLKPGGGTGKSVNQAEAERNPQEWDNAVARALASGLQAGRLPANIERLFEVRTEVKTDWRELLQLAITKTLGRDGHTWVFIDPELAVRGIGFPGRIRYGCNYIVVAFDTSGSINQKTINYFAANLQTIIETVHPKRLVVTSCDATIHSWDEIDDIHDLGGKVRGGGGTSFRPVFKRIEQEGEDPDMMIYLTDLYGDQHSIQQPDYPVIWGCINEQKAPWGTTIAIPKQTEEELA